MRNQAYDESEYQVPYYNTFAEFFEGLDREYGDQPALSWFTRKKEEKGYSYHEMIGRARALRESICFHGLAGTHIAIVSENSGDWLLAFLAAVSCGCPVVCVDIEQSDEGIQKMICRSDAKTVFLSRSYIDAGIPLMQEGKVEHVILMGDGDAAEGVLRMDELYTEGLERLQKGLDGTAGIKVEEDQIAEIVFTSGTTSESKMVMLSHKAVMQNMFDSSMYVNFHKRVFCSLPLYHAYGLNSAVLNTLLRGSHLYINGNLRTVMDELRMSSPDTLLTVPLMLEAIHNQIWLDAERSGSEEKLRKSLRNRYLGKRFGLPLGRKQLTEIREKAVGSLHLVLCGGAHLSREIAEEFELLGVQILQGYGITECSPLIAVNCNYANKLGSVGLPISSMEVKFVDGEVWVRGPSVMKGYYKDPEQTAGAMEDGWFKTGDLGYMDKDGYLYLTGRKKNLIVFKNGKKVSPERLEGMLTPIPLVKEVLVYGTANGTTADDVKLTASIYPDPERTAGMSSYEILDLLQKEIGKINAELPLYQQIQMITIREKEFPKTGTKKIKRYAE